MNTLKKRGKLLIAIFTMASIGAGIWACRSGDNEMFGERVNHYTLPTWNKKGVTAVIEIPAGTNHKIEYNPQTLNFEPDSIDGAVRIIDFLPYPANYGFIPSTLMASSEGGDGDPLDILVIAESMPTGTILAVTPIATLLMRDEGELDTKIIAIPVDPEQQVFRVADFQEFMLKYDPARRILESWMLNYQGPGLVELIGWRDDDFALSEIKKWEIKK